MIETLFSCSIIMCLKLEKFVVNKNVTVNNKNWERKC